MITIDQIKQLREKTGLSIMECKKALIESGGDEAKALQILRERGEKVVEKKAQREVKQGLIEAYIHSNKRVGVLLELLCETDFVARNPQFQELAHNLAMHIAAMNPLYLKKEDIPEEKIEEEKKIIQKQFEGQNKPPQILEQIIQGKIEKYAQEVCLLSQPYIKNEDQTIEDLIKEYINKLGENIKIGKFVRFEI